MASKEDLRRQFLQQRLSLHRAEWQTKSHQLCHQLQRTALFHQAQTVLIYWSTRQEPDLTPLTENPLNTHYRWGLSRCLDSTLVWHHWSPQDPLAKNRYGILEPVSTAPELQPDQVDLMLVPAVACDRQGYRLGYGGGFYDRLLQSPEWRNIPTIGLVFDFAYCSELPRDHWDQPLQAICTETQSVLRP